MLFLFSISKGNTTGSICQIVIFYIPIGYPYIRVAASRKASARRSPRRIFPKPHRQKAHETAKSAVHLHLPPIPGTGGKQPCRAMQKPGRETGGRYRKRNGMRSTPFIGE